MRANPVEQTPLLIKVWGKTRKYNVDHITAVNETRTGGLLLDACMPTETKQFQLHKHVFN